MTTGLMDEVEVQHIPTPDQIPNRLDLSQLPASVLRSAAVEALANQNEDLMARLGVAMRRSAQLENRIGELEQERSSMTNQIAIARDEVMILQEKDRRLGEIHASHDSESRANRDQLMLLEAQFSELYVTSTDRNRQQLEKLEQLDREIKRHHRYHRRINKAAENMRARSRSAIARLQREEEAGRELRSRLGEAAERIQLLSKQADSNQKQLVENYEASLKELRVELSKMESENQAYAHRTKDYEALFEKTVGLENRLIQEQRQFAQYRETREREIAQLQLEVSDMRTEKKSSLIETENLEQNYAQAIADRETLKEANSRFTDQVETLQMLWQDAQAQLEKIGVKNGALQSLNQQLSTTIQQQRQEIQLLKSQIEAQSLNTSDRIKEIKGQLQLINRANTLSFIEDQAPERVISRIDTLIAEIQSGFQRQAPTIGSTAESSSEDSRGNVATSAP